MFASHARRAVLAALSFTFIAVACKDDVLGPPDAAECTAGTVRAGRTVSGEIDGRSCVLWSDYDYEQTPAESWTFDAAANTAYIIRLLPVEDSEGVNGFNGRLHLFARTPEGDAVFAGGQINQFGPLNENGGSGRQMIIAPSAARRVSLRVQTESVSDTGAYSLEVIECPIIPIARGTTSAPLTLNNSCTLRNGPAADSFPVAFFGFAATSDEALDITATRTAGTATMQLHVGGPDIDFGCYTGTCTFTNSNVGAGPFVLRPNFRVDGDFVAMISRQSAGTLTATLRVAQTPAMVATPTAAVPSR